MPATDPTFTIGIEEEYLLVDQETLDLAEAPPELMEECQSKLQSQVSPEFLQCQIEVGTKVCQGVQDARDELKKLRACMAEVANKYGMSPVAVSCHPFAHWQAQQFTDKERYRDLERDLAGVARRMLICGMHIHVGIERDDARIDLMNQFPYFLPHLLALSTSSPYWEGRDTGLGSYRLTVFDNLPRTGLPPRFTSFSEYERSVQMIIDTGLIQDSSKIWWDLRPSSRFPTLETRICDVSPRLEDTLALAALTQCSMRMLHRLRKSNQRWRIYDSFLIGENRWRAQRYGVSNGLIDFGAQEVKPVIELLDEWCGLIEEDAAALNCVKEVEHVKSIAENGTSADRQRAVFDGTIKSGGDEDAAFRAVVDSLIGEFHEGL